MDGANDIGELLQGKTASRERPREAFQHGLQQGFGSWKSGRDPSTPNLLYEAVSGREPAAGKTRPGDWSEGFWVKVRCAPPGLAAEKA